MATMSRRRLEAPETPRRGRGDAAEARNDSRSSVLASSFLLLVTSACDPFGTGFDDVQGAQTYTAHDIKPATLTESASGRPRLRIMNYNVKFGGGRIDFFFDCHGDRVLMKKSEVIRNLEGLARK